MMRLVVANARAPWPHAKGLFSGYLIPYEKENLIAKRDSAKPEKLSERTTGMDVGGNAFAWKKIGSRPCPYPAAI